jgi:hypothetical protein
VDTEYEGPKNITDSLSWDENQNVKMDHERGADYLGKDGKVLEDEDHINNVPIKVVDVLTGKQLFYLHKMDWLTAQFPGTKDYRNVVDIIHHEDGSITENLELQKQLLSQLRDRIVKKFNTTGKHTETTIGQEGKGTGRMILNHETTGKSEGLTIKSKIVPKFAINKSSPEDSMLPDKSLKLVIMEAEGVPHSGSKYPFPGQLGSDTSHVPKGGVGAMVPAANGQFMYAPLIGQKIVEPGRESAGLNSISRAIELYLLNDGSVPAIGAEIDELQRNTGFNVATAKGLKGLIHQYYTYSQGFDVSALDPNNADGLKTEEFLFHINDRDADVLDKTKQIKAGFSMRGQGVQYANLTNGKLNPAFVELLKEGLATRSRAVNYTNAELGLKGINSIGEFTDANYNPSTGKWKHNTYEDYNEYVKSFSKTPVYGSNRLNDGPNGTKGTYVYTANPHLPMDIGRIMQDTDVVAKPNEAVEKVELPEEPKPTTDPFDDIFNPLSFSPQRTVNELGTGSDKSQELTLDNLEKLLNFTPEKERNGKTLNEVFKDLTERGHTYLSDGFNPFSRCL